MYTSSKASSSSISQKKCKSCYKQFYPKRPYYSHCTDCFKVVQKHCHTKSDVVEKDQLKLKLERQGVELLEKEKQLQQQISELTKQLNSCKKEYSTVLKELKVCCISPFFDKDVVQKLAELLKKIVLPVYSQHGVRYGLFYDVLILSKDVPKSAKKSVYHLFPCTVYGCPAICIKSGSVSKSELTPDELLLLDRFHLELETGHFTGGRA